jgi:TRAP-type C4-dicarboxylate transport system substrate-binding protein
MGGALRLLAASLLALVVLSLARPAHGETLIRVGTVAPEGSRFVKDLRAMTNEIERLSGGSVRFKWFTGGRLGDEKAMADTLMDQNGRLEGVAFTGIGLTHLVPEMKVWIYPGLFQDYDEVSYLENHYKAEFDGYFAREGLMMLTWAEAGFNYLHSAEKFNTFAELKKRRLWLWADDEPTLQAAAVLGIKTDATKLGELFDWLEAKKIQAWAYPPLAVLGFGLQKYSKYMSDMPFTLLVGAVVIRKDVYDKLPQDAQRAIKVVGEKWGIRMTRSWRVEMGRAIEAMKKQGTQVVVWSDEEKQKFFQACAVERGNVARKWNLEPLMRRFAADLEQFRRARQQGGAK